MDKSKVAITVRLLQIAQFIIAALQPSVIVIFLIILIYRLVFRLEEFRQSVEAFNLPIVALLAILIFKKEITEKISKLLQFKYGKSEAYFEKSSSENQERIASEQYAGFAKELTTAGLEEEKIEEIMKMAAAWGFNMAHMGFQTTPIPMIEWNGSAPMIKFGTSSSVDPIRSRDRDLLVAEIQSTVEEIDGLSIFQKMNNTNGLIPTRESVLRKKLQRLRDQLRLIDPNSIFLE
jgi:hypothetical protein